MMDCVAVVSVSFKFSERNAQRKEGRGGEGEKTPATEPRHFIKGACHRMNGCEVLILVSLLSIKLIAQNYIFRVSHRFYTSCAISILAYSVPVFHFALPLYLHRELERVQERALSVICAGLDYRF